MKFPLILASSVIAVVSAQDEQRLLVALAEKWYLKGPTFAFDSNTFNLTFAVTDIISTGMAQYSLWTAPRCQSEGGTLLDQSTVWVRPPTLLVENEALIAGASSTDRRGAFTGQNATIIAAFNPETVTTSSIYTDTSAKGQASAEIRFCTRFGLWTTEATGVNAPVEVNFLEILLTVTVDLTDGFKIGAINFEPKNRLLQTADRAYEVRGYECSANNFDELTEAEKSHPRNLGEIIHVCVTPENDAITDGIFIRSIDDFTFSRGDTIYQSAIKENRAAGNLTSYNNTECEGALVCRFSTILLAQFYDTPGTVLGIGVASMQSGNTKTGQTRRQLRFKRELQAVYSIGVSMFDVTIEVAQTEAQSESGAGSSSMGGAVTMAAIAAVAALL